MKIKTLLIAAATLAVGAISSQAQSPVYSQNIVGYATVIYPAGQLVFSANPLTTGHDVLTNIFTGTVPGASHVYVWNAAGSSFSTYTYSAAQHLWKSGATDVSNTNLPPGVGFFFSAASNYTNTYSGTIVANTGGGTATNSLIAGYQPVGSIVPYADKVTNTATINLGVAGASQLQIWDPIAQAFAPVFTYSAAQHTWKQGATATNPPIAVGQGFFVSPVGATNWVQTLQ